MCSGASISVIEAVVVMVRRFALFSFIFLLAFYIYISYCTGVFMGRWRGSFYIIFRISYAEICAFVHVWYWHIG